MNGRKRRSAAWDQTHKALQDAAVARFRRAGFDKTSVADIAGDADVSERTFYRHFPTKEAVLFGDQEARLAWLEHALEVRRDDEPLFDAVMTAMLMFPGDTELVREAARLRHHLVGQDQVLEALQRIQIDFASAISRYVARRLDDDPHHELLAKVAGNTIAAALLAVFDLWGQRGAVDDLASMDRAALEFLRSGLDLGPVSRPSADR